MCRCPEYAATAKHHPSRITSRRCPHLLVLYGVCIYINEAEWSMSWTNGNSYRQYVRTLPRCTAFHATHRLALLLGNFGKRLRTMTLLSYGMDCVQDDVVT